MKNCLEFASIKLTNFIVTFGVFAVIDALQKMNVITDVITLDRDYNRTDVLENMKWGAFMTKDGFRLKAPSDLIKHLIRIICNPGSPEEAIKINSALKCLCFKVNGNTGRFYDLMSEALYRRMMFYKLSQIYSPLIEEVKVNQEFVICMINQNLIDLNQLHELAGNDQAVKISQYIVHNINHYKRLKQFVYTVKNSVRDRNLIEDLEEIVYEIEIYQCGRIEDFVYCTKCVKEINLLDVTYVA